MVERRVLGKEKLVLVDGTEVEVSVHAVGFVEKYDLVKKHTTRTREKGFSYVEIDEISIRNDVLKIALPDIEINSLDYNMEELYNKYFGKNEDAEKKEKTSISGQTDTKSQETVQQ